MGGMISCSDSEYADSLTSVFIGIGEFDLSAVSIFTSIRGTTGYAWLG